MVELNVPVSDRLAGTVSACARASACDELTALEQAELDAFEQIEHVVVLLKARAHHLLTENQRKN